MPIFAVGTYTVTIDANVTVSELNLGAASGMQAISLDFKMLNITSAGFIHGEGELVVNGSSQLRGKLTVSSGGELNFSGSGNKGVYVLEPINQLGGVVSCGPSTVITNQGLWEIQGDYQMYGSGTSTLFENTAGGTNRKIAGGGVATMGSFTLINEGVIEPVAGTLRLTDNFQSTSGILRFTGGHLIAGGTLVLSGGTLEGSGSIGPCQLVGGVVSPGVGGPGKITFTSGLSMDTGVSLVIDSASGSTPGTEYDQISVIGEVSITNSTPTFTPSTFLPLGGRISNIQQGMSKDEGGPAFPGDSRSGARAVIRWGRRDGGG